MAALRKWNCSPLLSIASFNQLVHPFPQLIIPLIPGLPWSQSIKVALALPGCWLETENHWIKICILVRSVGDSCANCKSESTGLDPYTNLSNEAKLFPIFSSLSSASKALAWPCVNDFLCVWRASFTFSQFLFPAQTPPYLGKAKGYSYHKGILTSAPCAYHEGIILSGLKAFRDSLKDLKQNKKIIIDFISLHFDPHHFAHNWNSCNSLLNIFNKTFFTNSTKIQPSPSCHFCGEIIRFILA